MKTWGAFHWDKDTEWKKTMLKIWSLVSKGGIKMLIFAFAFFRFVSYIINYWILHVQVLRVFILEEVQINLSVLSPTSGPIELFQVQIQKWALVISEDLGHKLFDLSDNLKPRVWREYVDCNVTIDLSRL